MCERWQPQPKPTVIVGSQFAVQAQNVWSLCPMSPIQWICREWVKELGPNELKNGKYWIVWRSNTNQGCWYQWTFSPRRSDLYIMITLEYQNDLDCYNIFSLSIFRSPSHGGSLTLYISFWVILILHLLIIWVPIWVPVPSDTPFSLLWVVVAKAALFRGLLHINAARQVAAMHLMRW